MRVLHTFRECAQVGDSRLEGINSTPLNRFRWRPSETTMKMLHIYTTVRQIWSNGIEKRLDYLCAHARMPDLPPFACYVFCLQQCVWLHPKFRLLKLNLQVLTERKIARNGGLTITAGSEWWHCSFCPDANLCFSDQFTESLTHKWTKQVSSPT